MSRTWLEIEATLLEDLHAGSGLGKAGIDALLQRDRYNRPMVSRTHLEGLLRASASDPDIVTQLFGKCGGPAQRALFTSLRVNEATENINTRTWYATARTAFDNRAPRDDTMRITEYVPAGTVLSGKVLLPEELVVPFKNVLKRCAYLGAGRRRGDGLIRFAVREVPAPRGRRLPVRNGLCLRLRLCAVEPWCLAKTGQPGRIIPTEPYLRGQRLQGALIYWLLNWNGGPAAAGAIDWDSVSVGDALPLPPAITADELTGIEVLPIPLNLGRSKPSGTTGRLPWWAGDPAAPPTQDRFTAEESLKRPAEGEYLARSNSGLWYRYSPVINVHLHNAQGKRGKPPLLFSVAELAEDTRFVADIDFATDQGADAFVQAFREILEGRDWLTVGRGGAPAVVEQAVWVNRSEGVYEPYSAATVQTPFRLTLTSDLLILDDWLCWETHLTENRLKQLAGVPGYRYIRIERFFEDVVEIQGFNAASGLPRVPAYAIKSGSSYQIGGKDACALLKSLSGKKALGERTQLGFGRFRLDPDDKPLGLPEEHLQVGHRPGAPGTERAEQLLQRALDLAESIKGPPDGPSLSQWWALRDAIHSCKTSQEVQSRIDSLGHTQGGRVWCLESVKRVLEALKGCPQPEDAALLADAVIRWVFPKARGIEHV